MKKRRGNIPSGPGRHIPEFDDYELRPHYDFDLRKAKPNPFAGRVKFSHGGKRPGAGRKPAAEPVERHTVTLYRSHVSYLRSLDTNLSRAIRKLIVKSR